MAGVHAQDEYAVRLLWGQRGAALAAERGDVLVVVDTLSFSTLAATAVQFGATVYPCPPGADRAGLARELGAELAVGRDDVPAQGRFSLSPRTFVGVAAGTRVVVGSPNGAACARLAERLPVVLVGALVNAPAVGRVARRLVAEGARVTVLAAGERWHADVPSADGELRFALEDWLGAGAIVAAMAGVAGRSAEADAAALGFLAARGKVAELLQGCASGRELIERGYAADVVHAAEFGAYDAVAVMRRGWLERWE